MYICHQYVLFVRNSCITDRKYVYDPTLIPFPPHGGFSHNARCSPLSTVTTPRPMTESGSGAIWMIELITTDQRCTNTHHTHVTAQPSRTNVVSTTSYMEQSDRQKYTVDRKECGYPHIHSYAINAQQLAILSESPPHRTPCPLSPIVYPTRAILPRLLVSPRETQE